MERIVGLSSFLPSRRFPFIENRTPQLKFNQESGIGQVAILYESQFGEDEPPLRAVFQVAEDEFKDKIYQLMEGTEVVIFQNPHGVFQLKRGERDELIFSLSARTDSTMIIAPNVQIPGVVLDRI